ncbi:hypothetical protein HPB51_005963 [Rhipicephalus microplus]|uniref:Uncharacterized protein n=1 Tax=Rhipicephalus microplus TaxID=6941 RepID=A0A9J6E754_RHIMP|nr:hypothetical protein HPB51_005963 [Rhipicephalus microplus]
MQVQRLRYDAMTVGSTMEHRSHFAAVAGITDNFPFQNGYSKPRRELPHNPISGKTLSPAACSIRATLLGSSPRHTTKGGEQKQGGGERPKAHSPGAFIPKLSRTTADRKSNISLRNGRPICEPPSTGSGPPVVFRSQCPLKKQHDGGPGGRPPKIWRLATDAEAGDASRRASLSSPWPCQKSLPPICGAGRTYQAGRYTVPPHLNVAHGGPAGARRKRSHHLRAALLPRKPSPNSPRCFVSALRRSGRVFRNAHYPPPLGGRLRCCGSGGWCRVFLNFGFQRVMGREVFKEPNARIPILLSSPAAVSKMKTQSAECRLTNRRPPSFSKDLQQSSRRRRRNLAIRGKQPA